MLHSIPRQDGVGRGDTNLKIILKILINMPHKKYDMPLFQYSQSFLSFYSII